MTDTANTKTLRICMLQPEHQLLLSCARTQVDIEVANRIKYLLSNPIDWEYVFYLSARHHLQPLLYWNLNRICPSKIPQKAFVSLWAHFESVRHRNKLLSLELVRLVKHFESHDISVIPYKGPTAASLFYGNLALREFGDLDFLVRKDDLSKVCELLQADGYRNQLQLNAVQQQHYERQAKEYLYCRRKEFEGHESNDTICLEPHWSITMRKYPFSIDYPALWDRAQRVKFQGANLLSFAPEDTILILCMVGSKSQWKRLLMICDFAEAIRTYAEINWVNCLERARKLGCERMFLTAILLSGELLNSLPSTELIQLAKADRNVVKLAQDIHIRFFQQIRPTVLHPSLFSSLLWRLRERPQDKLHYLVSVLTAPQVVHLRRIPLPKPLFPLYRLIVPIYDYLLRPLWKKIKRLCSGISFSR